MVALTGYYNRLCYAVVIISASYNYCAVQFMQHWSIIVFYASATDRLMLGALCFHVVYACVLKLMNTLSSKPHGEFH